MAFQGDTGSAQVNVELILQALLSAAILSSVPLALAATGEAIGECAGVLNLGVEGTMLLGGFVAFWTALQTGSPTIGLVAGAAVGMLAGFVFGLLVVRTLADQVVLGLGLTLVGLGATGFMFREIYGSDQPLLQDPMSRPFVGWGDAVPIVGQALADQRWFVYVAASIVLVAHLLLTRTLPGLLIRAAGEAPEALEASGHSVASTRLMATSIAGALQGLGGAALCVVELGFFTPGAVNGSGFLAIALAMIGRRRPMWIGAFALGFGMLNGMDTGLQIANVGVRTEFLQMIPYIGMVVALIILGRNDRVPAALGVPWRSRRQTH